MKAWVKGVIAGAVIAAIGVIILIAGLYFNDWNYAYGAGNITMETAEFDSEPVNSILINVDSSAVKTEYYEGEKIIVDYPVSERYVSEVVLTDKSLRISGRHRRFWWQILSFNFGNLPEITIKLPFDKVVDLTLNMDAGKARIASGAFGKIDLKLSAGDVHLDDVVCENFNAELDAGYIQTKNIACTNFNADLNAGSVKTGNVVCSNFKADLNAGYLSAESVKATNVTCVATAGKIKLDGVTSETANFNISAGKVAATFTGKQSDYNISVHKSAGECNVESSSSESNRFIIVNVSAGSAELNFA